MTEENYIQLCEGAKMIKAYCEAYCKEVGLDIEDIKWITDFTAKYNPSDSPESHILTVMSESGSTEISLSREDLEDYPGGNGTEKTNAKIKQSVNGIK